MPPVTKKGRPICKICPEQKKIEIQQVNETGWKEEEEEEGEAKEREIEEEEEEEEEEIEEPCLNVDGYGDFELTTAGPILTEILPARKKKPAFFSSCSEKVRYENLIPCDVTNDNQYNASRQENSLKQMSQLRVVSDPRWKRTPAIIATIGPSCMTVEQIEEMLSSGANVVRINLAYGDRCGHLSMIRNVRAAEKNISAKVGFHTPIAIMLDLKGLVIQTGRICKLYIRDCSNPQIFLEKDKMVKLTVDKYMADKCTPRLIYINYPDFAKFVRPGMKICLDDGSVKLIAQNIEEREITCIVDEEGYLGNNRNVHLPMIPITSPAYTPADIEDIFMAIEEEVDIITYPKARNPRGIQDLREKLTEKLLLSRRMRERPILLFAKISTYEGLSNVDAIIREADGVVIQRQGLGLDIPSEKVFIAQREIIAKCNIAGKPVIVSTQLARSMLEKVEISKSEVSDIAACIQDGADGVALTHETAIGKYPNETIEMVNHIIREADAATYQKNHLRYLCEFLPPTIDPKIAIAMAACTVAEKVQAPAIIVLTTSGKAAKFISWFRPRAVVLAITRYERTARQLNLWRVVIPIHHTPPCTIDWFMDMERQFQHGIAYGKEFGFIRAGDPLVLVSSYGKNIGFTNSVRVVYASTEPDVFLEHPKEFYSGLGMERKFPCSPCK